MLILFWYRWWKLYCDTGATREFYSAFYPELVGIILTLRNGSPCVIKKKRVHFNSCPSFKLDQYMFGYAYLNTYCESHAFHGGDQLTCTSIATMPHQNTPIIQGERYNSLQLKGTGLNQMNIDLMCLWNWPVLNRTLMLYQHRSVAYPSLWGIWRGEGAWIEDVKEP